MSKQKSKMTKLKSKRINRGIMQIRLAEQLKMPLRTLQDYESGLRIPNVITAQRLAIALDCQVSDIFPLPEGYA